MTSVKTSFQGKRETGDHARAVSENKTNVLQIKLVLAFCLVASDKSINISERTKQSITLACSGNHYAIKQKKIVLGWCCLIDIFFYYVTLNEQTLHLQRISMYLFHEDLVTLKKSK